MKLPLATTLVSLLLLAGCSTTPNWDDSFGDSVRQARAGQLIDPLASSRRPPAEGLDGKAATGVMRDYVEYYGFGGRDPKPVAPSHVNPR